MSYAGSGKVSEWIQSFIKPCGITGALLKGEAGEMGKAPDLLITLVDQSVGYRDSDACKPLPSVFKQ